MFPPLRGGKVLKYIKVGDKRNCGPEMSDSFLEEGEKVGFGKGGRGGDDFNFRIKSTKKIFKGRMAQCQKASEC